MLYFEHFRRPALYQEIATGLTALAMTVVVVIRLRQFEQSDKLKFATGHRTGQAQWCGTNTAAKTRMVSGNLPRKIRYFFPVKDGKSFTKWVGTARIVANATERKEDSL